MRIHLRSTHTQFYMGLLESQQGSGPDTPFCAAVDGAFEIYVCQMGLFKQKMYSIYPRTAKINGEHDDMMNIHPIQGYLNHMGFARFFLPMYFWSTMSGIPWETPRLKPK